MHPLDDAAYFTEQEVAELLRTTKRSLLRGRVRGDGPPFVKFGRKLLYRRAALIDWLAARETKGGVNAA
jgi:Helix-turn-helix domain